MKASVRVKRPLLAVETRWPGGPEEGYGVYRVLVVFEMLSAIPDGNPRAGSQTDDDGFGAYLDSFTNLNIAGTDSIVSTSGCPPVLSRNYLLIWDIGSGTPWTEITGCNTGYRGERIRWALGRKSKRAFLLFNRRNTVGTISLQCVSDECNALSFGSG